MFNYFFSVILELEIRVHFSTLLKPICLPTYIREGVEMKHIRGIIAGWGYDGQSWGTNLKEVDAVILKNSVCEVIMELQGRKIWEKGGFSEPHPRPYPLLLSE